MSITRWLSLLTVILVLGLVFVSICHPSVVSRTDGTALDFCDCRLTAKQQAGFSFWFSKPPLHLRLWPLPFRRVYQY